MLPLGRIGQPIDIARGVQFLSCSDSDWITGQVFVADGGLTAGHYNLQGLQDFTMLGGHL
jgi:NAD(P)-dependent dehydrogenase (short-subunit alcohol dehydrogenase family)